MQTTVELAFSNLITELPQIVVATVGLILVRNRLKSNHPKALRYGTIGLALLLANGLWGLVSRTYLQAAQLAQEPHPIALANSTSMASAAGYVVFIAAIAFIAAAIVADRNELKNSHDAA